MNQDKIEEIKEILDRDRSNTRIEYNGTCYFKIYALNSDELAKEICQLFEPKPLSCKLLSKSHDSDGTVRYFGSVNGMDNVLCEVEIKPDGTEQILGYWTSKPKPDGTQGYTWNPITGCLNGCEYCYARKLAHGRLWSKYIANHQLAPSAKGIHEVANDGVVKVDGDYLDPFYPRFWRGRLLDARDELCNAKPRGIFVCDMSDLFGIGIPEEWTRQVLGLIRMNPVHRFYLLTKQPQNLLKFSPFPDNCWVGVTATTYKQFQDALEGLCQIVARVKYISFEPLLESIEIWHSSRTADNDFTIGGGIDWVIIGAQTNPYKPPKIEWVEEIVKACEKAEIPVFLKFNLSLIFANMTIEERRQYPSLIKTIGIGFELRQEIIGYDMQ